jgi:hypothetical protein
MSLECSFSWKGGGIGSDFRPKPSKIPSTFKSVRPIDQDGDEIEKNLIYLDEALSKLNENPQRPTDSLNSNNPFNLVAEFLEFLLKYREEYSVRTFESRTYDPICIEPRASSNFE